VFGIGRDVPQANWQALARQLEASEALVRDPDHGGLMLGPAARPILKGEASIALREIAATPGRERRDRAGRPAGPDDPLFEALRRVRRDLAAASGVPPYVVFHDATLRAMAADRPATMGDLGRVSGVGARKLEAYGAAFLEVLRAA